MAEQVRHPGSMAVGVFIDAIGIAGAVKVETHRGKSGLGQRVGQVTQAAVGVNLLVPQRSRDDDSALTPGSRLTLVQPPEQRCSPGIQNKAESADPR